VDQILTGIEAKGLKVLPLSAVIGRPVMGKPLTLPASKSSTPLSIAMLDPELRGLFAARVLR